MCIKNKITSVSLENSLDAKIDSLVSSYLTRNGIWNGARQIELNNTEVANGGRFLFSKADDVDGNKFMYNIASVSSETKDLLSRTNLVSTITKSGLCFAELQIKNSAYWISQYSLNQGNINVNGTIYYNDNVCKGVGVVIGNMYINSATNPIATVQLDNMIAGTYTQPQSQLCFIRREMHFTAGRYMMNFFVNKGDALYFDIKAYVNYTLAFGPPHDATKGASDRGGITNGPMAIYLVDVSVY